MSLHEWWLNFLFVVFLYLFALDFISDGGFELGTLFDVETLPVSWTQGGST